MKILLTQFGNKIGNNVYLPYAIGSIVSYCKFKAPEHEYNMMYIKDDIDSVVYDIMEYNPDILAFSTYIWNHEYNIAVAKRVKEITDKIINNKIMIVFGGHHIDGYDEKIFEKYPFINCIINGEGEHAFLGLIKDEMELINTTVNISGRASISKTQNFEIDINEIPSPYLTGIFDKILKDGYNFTASLETNRGCPYGCVYCDWGSPKTSNKKMRLFDIKRVYDEIKWFGINKIEFVFGCDSNFGLYKDRDMKIIDEFIHTKVKYGYPEKFRVCYAKNSNEIIFEMNKKLDEYNLSKGATLSFQSMNQETTRAIGRTNLSIEEFNKYIKMYNTENIPVYTEMIIGLPEETYESFKDGIDILLNNNQHGNIVIYYCQVYPNSRLNNPEYKKKYGIETATIDMYPTHTIIDENQIFEKEEIIIKTNTLSNEDWLNTCMFSWVIQCFHGLGFTRFIAIHMKEVYGISYKEFYQNMINFFENSIEDVIGQAFDKASCIFNNVLMKKSGFKYIIDVFNWTVEEGSYIELIRHIDSLYFEIFSYIHDQYDCKTSEILDVIKFNKHMLNKYYNLKEECAIGYNLLETFKRYFETGEYKLEKQYMKILIEQKQKYSSFDDWAKHVVWYGRKGGSTLKEL